MNWDAIGATGEWAGAIAVVASLIYLATQVRHANRQTQAAARYSFLEAYGQLNTSIAHNKDTEPPRNFRRLHFLRGWSYEYNKTIFPGGPGTSGSNGV